MLLRGKLWLASKVRRVAGLDEALARQRRLESLLGDAEIRQNVRLDENESRLNGRLDETETRQNARLDQTEARLGARLEAIESRMNARADEIESRIKPGLEEIESRLNARGDELIRGFHTAVELITRADNRLRQLQLDTDDKLRDILAFHMGIEPPRRLRLTIDTENPVAVTSPDHTDPRGTANDNTRHPRFVRACEHLFPSIRHLDIGCAGGGLVWDFAVRGHLSVGVEGSDYSLRAQRAEWRTIPDRLFTADICHPFRFSSDDGALLDFNVITAWELFEHIPTPLVDDTIGNIVANLSSDGILVCSIATFVDRDEATGIVYHQTVLPREWWLQRFAAKGLVAVESLFDHADFVRGSGNPRAWDWNAATDPQMGFHLVLRRAT